MLSRVGFLKSFDDALLDEAHTALEDALRTGVADKWVTSWNLANISARKGDLEGAKAQLDDVSATFADWRGYAFVLVFVPGRSAADCLIKVTDAGIATLLELQRAVVASISGDSADLGEVLDRCRACEDAGTTQAAEWVAEALAATG